MMGSGGIQADGPCDINKEVTNPSTQLYKSHDNDDEMEEEEGGGDNRGTDNVPLCGKQRIISYKYYSLIVHHSYI